MDHNNVISMDELFPTRCMVLRRDKGMERLQ